MSILFPRCMLCLRLQSEFKVRAGLLLLAVFHLLCGRGISVLFHQTILMKEIMMIVWVFTHLTHWRWGLESKLPGCSGWTTATQTSTHQSLTNIRCVKDQDKEISLEIRQWCKSWSVLGYYQQRLFKENMCACFSVNHPEMEYHGALATPNALQIQRWSTFVPFGVLRSVAKLWC